LSERETKLRLLDRTPIALGVVVLVCALVYLPMLGSGGLTMSEGHRAIPAWEMMDTGEWLVPHIFGQPYLRKPPGMPWAIAGMSMVFGQTAMAARMVSALSATTMALVAAGFAGRWFGKRWMVVGGLAQALMPVSWAWGRSAEIETLNALGAQLVMLGIIEMVRTRRGRWAWVGSACVASGVIIAGLAKGPSAGPCVVGAILGASVAFGVRGGLGNWRVWLSLAAPLAMLGWLFVRIAARAGGLEAEPVTQSVGAFMWEPGRVASVALLPVAAWASVLPISLGFLFVWGPNARRECVDDQTRDSLRTARALAWTWVGAIVVLMIAGVSNPRYALPAAGVMPLLVVYVLAGYKRGMVPRRAHIARVLSLGNARRWLAVLLILAWVFIGTAERKTRGTSGEGAGVQLGQAIAAGVLDGHIPSSEGRVRLAADHLIEARPEVLWYATESARLGGVDLEVRWLPRGLESAAGFDLIAVRSDAGSLEGEAFGDMATIYQGRVHKYGFRVVAPLDSDDR
jgi:4-amino-4-deoxy-L-arabinose transferase-like glycosyltransferase